MEKPKPSLQEIESLMRARGIDIEGLKKQLGIKPSPIQESFQKEASGQGGFSQPGPLQSSLEAVFPPAVLGRLSDIPRKSLYTGVQSLRKSAEDVGPNVAEKTGSSVLGTIAGAGALGATNTIPASDMEAGLMALGYKAPELISGALNSASKWTGNKIVKTIAKLSGTGEQFLNKYITTPKGALSPAGNELSKEEVTTPQQLQSFMEDMQTRTFRAKEKIGEGLKKSGDWISSKLKGEPIAETSGFIEQAKKGLTFGGKPSPVVSDVIEILTPGNKTTTQGLLTGESKNRATFDQLLSIRRNLQEYRNSLQQYGISAKQNMPAPKEVKVIDNIVTDINTHLNHVAKEVYGSVGKNSKYFENLNSEYSKSANAYSFLHKNIFSSKNPHLAVTQIFERGGNILDDLVKALTDIKSEQAAKGFGALEKAVTSVQVRNPLSVPKMFPGGEVTREFTNATLAEPLKLGVLDALKKGHSIKQALYRAR